MKRLLLFLAILSLISCTTVSLVKHPDFNYAPTNPAYITIYDQFIPTYDFFIIGRMTIDATWTLSGREAGEKIQARAASIGGDGVILTSSRIDVYAFNRGTTTEGSATVWGRQVNYSETTRDDTIYVPKKTVFAYVIKRRNTTGPDGASAVAKTRAGSLKLLGKASGGVGTGAKASVVFTGGK